MATEEEIVPRLNGHGVTHEDARIAKESCGHGARDTADTHGISVIALVVTMLSNCSESVSEQYPGGVAHISGSF